MTPSNDTLTTASCEDSRIAVSRCSRAGRESLKFNRLSEGGSVPRNGASPAGERVGPAGKVRYASAVAVNYPPNLPCFSRTQRIEEIWYSTSKPPDGVVPDRRDNGRSTPKRGCQLKRTDLVLYLVANNLQGDAEPCSFSGVCILYSSLF